MTKKSGNTLISRETNSGSGFRFEHEVEAAFSILMLTEGRIPLLFENEQSRITINEIAVQTANLGYNTDDMCIYAKNQRGEDIKLLCQMKKSIRFSRSDSEFVKTIKGAWNDFKNPDKFNRGIDKFVIITRLLNYTETSNTRRILEMAHASKTEELFHSHFKNNKRKMDKIASIYSAFPEGVSNQETFEFLQHLKLYSMDLDIEGMMLPFLYSIIPFIFPGHSPEAIWGQLCFFWQEQSTRPATLRRLSLLEYLRDLFPESKKREEYLPGANDAFPMQQSPEKKELMKFQYFPELIPLFFVNSWAEQSDADIEILSMLFGKPYSEVKEEIRKQNNADNSLVKYKKIGFSRDFYYEMIDPLSAWKVIAPKLLMHDLFSFRKAFQCVFQADKHKYSMFIRKGLAKSLAIIANNIDAINPVIANDSSDFASLCLHDIFGWESEISWRQNDDVITHFAEASPIFILNRLEKSLDDDSKYLKEAFYSQGFATIGTTANEIMRSLSMLARESCFLNQCVAILGKIANKYKEFDKNKELIQTIAYIYLPWRPQTMADFDEQVTSLKLLHNESPDVYYQVLLFLLPGKITHAFRNNRESWRNKVPADLDDREVLMIDYIRIEIKICELIVEYAKEYPEAIVDIVENIKDFRPEVFGEVVSTVTKGHRDLDDDQRLKIWHILDVEISRHEYFSEANWAMNKDSIDKLKIVKGLYTPDDIVETSLRIFSWSTETHEGKYEKGNSKKLIEKTKAKRIETIINIFDCLSMDGIRKLVAKAKDIYAVSEAAASAELNISDEDIRSLLISEDNAVKQFILFYMSLRASISGIEWARSIDITKWNNEEKAWFFCALPFTSDYWVWAESELKKQRGKYWTKLKHRRFLDDKDHQYAIEKLLKYNNTDSAVDCLWMDMHSEIAPKIESIIIALKKVKKQERFDAHQVRELLEYLQNQEDIDFETLSEIEFDFINKLDHYYISIKNIERKIALQPDYFVQLVKKRYGIAPFSTIDDDEWDAVVNILYKWTTIPGMGETGCFSENLFFQWLHRVQEIAYAENISEYTDMIIGGVLIYAPKDETGIPINSIARLLNDNTTMRDSFRTSLFNARGMHYFSAKDELALAEKYQLLTNAAKASGYRKLSEMYKQFEDEHRKDARRYAEEE